VQACTNLRYIDLALCLNLSDSSVTAISTLQNLLRIGLVRLPNLTDEAVFALANRPTLERIHLSYCEDISVAAIAHLLNRVPRITHISLTGVTAFRDDKLGLQDIRRAPPADFTEHQRVVFCVFSGQGVQDLRKRLKTLHVSDSVVIDDKPDAVARPTVA